LLLIWVDHLAWLVTVTGKPGYDVYNVNFLHKISGIKRHVRAKTPCHYRIWSADKKRSVQTAGEDGLTPRALG